MPLVFLYINQYFKKAMKKYSQSIDVTEIALFLKIMRVGKIMDIMFYKLLKKPKCYTYWSTKPMFTKE